MGDEVRQVLHRVLTANQATGPLTEAGEGDLLTSLRALNKLCWQADAVIKAEALSVLSAAVLSPRYSAEVRAHAAGVVGLVVNHDKRTTLGEQLAECLVAMVASDHRLAQKKALKAIHHSQYASLQNRNLLVDKGVIEALARFIGNTPFLATNWMRFRWACGALGHGFTHNVEYLHRIAACDNLLHTVVELLKVRSPNYGYAKCSVSLYFQELARSDVALHTLIHEQSLATAWRYLLYHAKHSPAKKERVAMLKLYVEAIVAQRSKAWRVARTQRPPEEHLLHPSMWNTRSPPPIGYSTSSTHGTPILSDVVFASSADTVDVKLLARARVGATAGDAQSGLDALLAFVFMSPDREEKTQMLLDRCGLDALFKALANESSALNVLTAFNCLTLGVGGASAYVLAASPQCCCDPVVATATAPRAAALAAVAPPAAAAVAAPDPRIPRPVRRNITQSGCFAQWRADQALHDVAFRFPSEGGVTVTAHKLLLAGKSAVFKAMFTSGMREARRGGADDDDYNNDADGLPVVAIPNIASRTFQLLLDFCYGVHLLEPPSPVATGTTATTTAPDPQRAILNTLDAMAAWLSRAGASLDEVAALLAAAGQYEILDLEDGCAHFLGARLSGLNVMDMLRLGLMHRSPILVFRCFEFVLADPSVVLLKRAVTTKSAKVVTSRKSPSRAAATPSTQPTTDDEQAKKNEGKGEGDNEGEDGGGGEDDDEDESEMEIDGTSHGNTTDEPGAQHQRRSR
ncbi:BTB/POZ domain containing protein [Acanthamoeba castellanii str. Neff]|uniref:BTB/POZ domain containing protein n=1 Tax=Acanthamoeba castellanii (strain ATCC 30010 / Neff) TaxID=1257118 RepID=L8GYY6_ACACF|nr:BTB/POZ domain containing protein [Acanthamoeba castellanii str. Neff]ELR18484.1 BTB/POZ domain containing protein [Acanthamoeba castellanii str. Neff]